MWGQIAGSLTHLVMEEGLQASEMIHLVDLLAQEECSLQIMDQDQVICSHRTLISEVQEVSQAKEALAANLSDPELVEVDSMIHSADQEEEEAVSDQAEAAWVAALVHQEEALAEAVALAVDLVVLETTEI